MPSILVVEQEERYVERIRAALTSEGWKVRVVPGADQAIQAAASEAPDLVMVSAEVPAAGTLAGAFSRSGGGPGAVGLLPEGAAFAPPGFAADDLLAKPFTDESLRAAARRALEARRPAAASPQTSQTSQTPARAEHKLTSHDIFGDVLAEVEGPASRPAATKPPAPPPAPPSPPAPPAPDDEMQRRLEKTLSGVLTPETRPRPAAPAPPAAPPRRSEPAADNVDALLSRTLSNLDLGKTKTGVRAPAPAVPAPPPPAAAAPAPPPVRPAVPPPAPVAEGTEVRKARPPQRVGDFDFSELEELARTGRTPSPPPTPPARPAPPAPAAVAPAPAAPLPFQAPEPAVPPRPAAPVSLASGIGDAAATQRIPVFADEPAEGERFGQYTLLERIAAGGMAEVWQARMRGVEGFQKTVAIKRILPHMTDNAEFVGMFIDEAKLAAQLSHPNIVHIYDLGKIGRDYYIAMEYVEGKDLRSLLNAGRRRDLPLPLALSLMIAARVASALDYAHRKRDFEGRELSLVHRDVSPQNVLLSYDGDVKLCDFGIAKAVSKASQTQMGALKGKLQYMSPEQAWGRAVDARSDLFSLGAVLFEMVTGERLFQGDSEMSVLEAVRQGRVRSPRQVNPAVPQEVDEIVTRALAVDPQARFQTAGEMKQRLEAVLAALPSPAGSADLAAYIQRALEPGAEPPAAVAAPAANAPAAVPVSWTPEPVLPAAAAMAGMAAPPAEVDAPMAPITPVAPVGEVAVEEEGGRKSRTFLYAAIAALIVVAILTFFFLNRRRGDVPAAAPGAGATTQVPGTPPATAPAPVPAPQPTPVPAANAANAKIQAMVDQQLAKVTEEQKKKYEQQQKELEKQLAAAKAAGKPAPGPQQVAQATPGAPPAPVPTPAVRPPAPEPVASPPPTPEPQREPEPAKAQEKAASAASPAPEPARAPEPAAARVHAGDLVEAGPGVAPPQLVSFPKPEYPPLARKLRVQGVVVVSVLIDDNGQVQDVRMVEPIPQKVGINEAALAAARSARYKPATKQGVRVKMWTRLKIPFTM
ncbi:MAG TPA: TonB family protein [Thermoanaerobaculia bacterium]|nr:TonB family protein [Thermoanaerobaculia bacterium]